MGLGFLYGIFRFDNIRKGVKIALQLKGLFDQALRVLICRLPFRFCTTVSVGTSNANAETDMDSVSSTQRIAFFMLWEPPNVEIGYGLLFS